MSLSRLATNKQKAWRNSRNILGKTLKLLSDFFEVVFIISLFLLLNMGFQQVTGNFHEVLAGELYRSAQPDAEDIAGYRERFGIRTIVNLRDETRGEWYRIEEEAAREHDITLIDFPLSSARGPSLEDMERLASIMAKAKKPVLVHCEHGSNRTGLASAIYVAGTARMWRGYAHLQLSPLYGHVPIPGIGRYNIFRSWLEFRRTHVRTRN